MTCHLPERGRKGSEELVEERKEKSRNEHALKTASIDPFMPSGLFYLNSLDQSISSRRGVWLIFNITMHVLEKALYLMQTE